VAARARLWWGLLVAGLVVGVFGWGVTVLGIALATAQEGTDQWWLVPGAPLPATGEPLEPLSERELEVLRLVATGRSNREIATELYVATGTVKAHLNNIFRKLEARSRLEAVTRARDLRLLAERDPK
jgi:DNA-binding NarL/FixJ family response regulator